MRKISHPRVGKMDNVSRPRVDRKRKIALETLILGWIVLLLCLLWLIGPHVTLMSTSRTYQIIASMVYSSSIAASSIEIAVLSWFSTVFLSTVRRYFEALVWAAAEWALYFSRGPVSLATMKVVGC